MLTTISILFLLGYLLIIFENKIKIDKAAIAILTGVVLWTFVILNPDFEQINQHLDMTHILGDISAILFFLLGAMTIVELVDLNKGFDIISTWFKTKNKIILLIFVCTISFFLSAILDNLTTTIVMISIVRKLINDPEDRMWFVSLIVIAANSGGAWSPLGDVTTTMLWIEEKVSTIKLIKQLFIPSLLSILIPLIIISKQKRFRNQVLISESQSQHLPVSSTFYLVMGIVLLILVPVFKTVTGLPPFIGMMGALSIIWLVSELKNPMLFPENSDLPKPTVQQALSKIEIPSLLFFFGILLAISALEHAGKLNQLGLFLGEHLENPTWVAFILGLLSAVIDNVPLVAGSLGMYDYPTDDIFWHELAYAAGTGGSILIIGSAAGVVAMGMEKISYSWYFKRISLLALLGYIAGWIYMIDFRL